MRWDERQRAMLREMGIRLWAPEAEPEPDAVRDSGSGDSPVLTAERESAVSPVPAVGRAPGDAGGRIGAAPIVAAVIQPAALPASPVGALDWPALRAAVSACTACKLCEGRRQTVFGIGNERAHWMIVGEAPGEQEDRRGEPFVGKAGQLLDKMILAMGLKREQVYIANIVKCRPPGNRAPAPEETEACTPYLVEQIGTVRPRVIVTLGLPAARFMLQSNEAMGRLRGNWRAWRGIKLMPTYHPAYVLRSYTPETRAAVWSDLQQVMNELGLKKRASGKDSV